MNRTSDNAVEELLERATPRPAPPGTAEQQVRAAVRAEWTRVAQRRRRRRTLASVAMAASVLLAVTASLSVLRTTGIAPVEVASIDRSVGTLYFQSRGSGELEPVDTSTIVAGQMLTTGSDSAAGLAWHDGGSLRIDSDTRVEFVSADEIFLHHGRVYFDSFGTAAGSGFAIRTEHGVVTHVGTQYLTESDRDNLTVSVREGEVAIDGAWYDRTVSSGQRVRITGSATPQVSNTTGVGGDWEWIESVSPQIAVDGMTVFDFLHWVGRETGYAVRFDSAAAEDVARQARLKGVVYAEPRTELRLRMMTVDLDARFDPDETVIVVTR